MPESNAEKIRRLAMELARIRNQLRELVSEQAGGELPQTAVSATPLPAARAAAPATEDFSPPPPAVRSAGAGDPLEEILKASPPVTNQAAEAEDDDVVVVDISLPADKPAGAARKPDVAQDTAPGTTSSDAQPGLSGSKPAAKNYPPPPRKRK